MKNITFIRNSIVTVVSKSHNICKSVLKYVYFHIFFFNFYLFSFFKIIVLNVKIFIVIFKVRFVFNFLFPKNLFLNVTRYFLSRSNSNVYFSSISEVLVECCGV